MEEKRMVLIGVGAVLAVSTITLLAVTMSATSSDDNIPVPEGTNKTNPLLLISLDGFRSDYISRYVPILQELAMEGVTASYMMPVYPTLTFPNHYSIVTGLYPAAHGIVANNFYDPDFGESFSMSSPDGKWWGGEPIWNTLVIQNKTSATYFWPGSDHNISGIFPTYWYPYDGGVSYTDRVDQVLKWLSMPEEERPDFVSLYFDEPDTTGHHFGPSSYEVDEKLRDIDNVIGRLLTGLRENKLQDKVNIIVLADHGMTKSSPALCLNLTTYVSNIIESTTENFYGSFTTLRLKNSSYEAINDMLSKLACPAGSPEMRAYVPQDLPARFHYSNNKRIGDIVLDLDRGYYTYDFKNGDPNYLGQHGYDNYISLMGALFIASGPDFKKNMTLEPFQNIELYNLMCLLTGVEPAPNNGTHGALYNALLDPPPIPELPLEDQPPAATYPEQLDNSTLTMANCKGDLSENSGDLSWLEALNITEAEQQELEDFHLPWGIPMYGNVSDYSVLLLHHQDHITGYSEKLRMPVWTSFTVDSLPVGTVEDNTWWCSDVRLTPENTATCDSYDKPVQGREVTMFPLFNPWFSVNATLERIPYLVSNAVPMYATTKTVDYVTSVLTYSWISDITPLNLMFGLVFDNDADSLPDDFTNFTIPEVPSDIFLVVTRCRQLVTSFKDCEEKDVDALSFIFPTLQTVDNKCMDYRTSFLATLRDVECITGLTFFPNLEPVVRLQLALRIYTTPWRIPS